MDIKGIFFQTSVDDDIAPMEGVGMRQRVKALCPGNKANLVLVAKGAGCLEFLKRNLENVGKCTSFIVLYDETGTAIGAYELPAGKMLGRPSDAPSNTFFIKYGCDPKCGGDAILEFDMLYA